MDSSQKIFYLARLMMSAVDVDNTISQARQLEISELPAEELSRLAHAAVGLRKANFAEAKESLADLELHGSEPAKYVAATILTVHGSLLQPQHNRSLQFVMALLVEMASSGLRLSPDQASIIVDMFLESFYSVSLLAAFARMGSVPPIDDKDFVDVLLESLRTTPIPATRESIQYFLVRVQNYFTGDSRIQGLVSDIAAAHAIDLDDLPLRV